MDLIYRDCDRYDNFTPNLVPSYTFPFSFLSYHRPPDCSYAHRFPRRSIRNARLRNCFLHHPRGRRNFVWENARGEGRWSTGTCKTWPKPSARRVWHISTSECFSANAFSGTHAAISWMPSSSTRASTLARIIPISRFCIPEKFLSFVTFALCRAEKRI